MRKFSVLVIIAALLSPLPAVLAEARPDDKSQYYGGFYGPMSGAQAETVARARELDDDAPVALTGNIVSQVAGKKHKFVFRDQSGEILIDIDKKAFRGHNLTPADTVRISGKVDKDFGKDVEIDVKQIDVMK